MNTFSALSGTACFLTACFIAGGCGDSSKQGILASKSVEEKMAASAFEAVQARYRGESSYEKNCSNSSPDSLPSRYRDGFMRATVDEFSRVTFNAEGTMLHIAVVTTNNNGRYDVEIELENGMCKSFQVFVVVE
jgi:hypothetical protein